MTRSRLHGARAVPTTWVSYRDAFRMLTGGVTARVGLRIAAVVGTWYTVVNQSGLLLRGDFPWVKIVLNYATPFCVSSLGFLAGRRRSNIERLAALLDEPEFKN